MYVYLVISVYMCTYILHIYVVNVNDIEWYRVQQELMARIIREMHDRQYYSPAVQSQLNPDGRLVDHASEASSLASDVETTDDPLIGLCLQTNCHQWNRNKHLAGPPMCSTLLVFRINFPIHFFSIIWMSFSDSPLLHTSVHYLHSHHSHPPSLFHSTLKTYLFDKSFSS